ncbi:MAG: purine-binding chemotaxis protein CheW [Spirochaetales bacterium]|nr:purine-binding chemotaxis protein CheW [Spirochaetales bacterium]
MSLMELLENEVNEVDGDKQDLYLIFSLANEDYGIKISKIVQIVEMQTIITIPHVKQHFKGIMTLRGQIIPLMDLRIRFSLPEGEYTDRTSVIVVNVEDQQLGLIVDFVKDVSSIAEKMINRSEEIRNMNNKSQYIEGLGKIDKLVAILVDVEKLV